MRWLALVLLLLSGCASTGEPAPPAAVQGTLELQPAAAGPPDAGTRAGHGGDRFAATAGGPLLEIHGRVEPAGARIEIVGGKRRAHANVERDGSFRAVLPALRHGRNLFDLTASVGGAEPWRTQILVTRAGGPRRRAVVVPSDDTTPPRAILVLRSAGSVLSAISPVRDRDEAPLELADRRVDLEAVVRDADGGTGRVRASLTYTVECPGEAPRQRTHHFPPSEIARVQLPPGARVPAERRRRARVSVAAPPGCVARGEAWADATNASGLESFSDQIALEFQG